MTRVCVNCKHYGRNDSESEIRYPFHQCLQHKSLINGATEMRDAETNRNGAYTIDPCGPEGKYFEAKPVDPTRTDI